MVFPRQSSRICEDNLHHDNAMKSRAVLVILALAATIILICLLIKRLPQFQEQPAVARSETLHTDNGFYSERAKLGETSSQYGTPNRTETPPSIPSVPMDRVTVPKEEVRPSNDQLFQLRGGGNSTAKIIDLEGKIVLEAPPYNTIASYSVSPSGGRVLVYHGNSDYEVFDPATKSRTVLPQQPPGEKKLAFSAWHWIDEDTVIGQSGDELAERKEIPGEDTMDIQGRLYLYNISHRALAKVQLPNDFDAKMFSVTEVSPSGYVHLVNEDPNATRPRDLGWFQVRPKK
jgi:hypothetical protein